MSKGTKMTGLRIPPPIESAMLAAIDSANDRRKEEAYTKTTWILQAIKEKLRQLAWNDKRKAAKQEKGVQ